MLLSFISWIALIPFTVGALTLGCVTKLAKSVQSLSQAEKTVISDRIQCLLEIVEVQSLGIILSFVEYNLPETQYLGRAIKAEAATPP